MDAEDQQAMEWASANPDHPLAKQILALHTNQPGAHTAEPREQSPLGDRVQSFGTELANQATDALPGVGAALGGVGGAIAGAGTPATLATVPAGGALGGFAGAQLKRLIDFTRGRDTGYSKDPVLGDTLLPRDPLGSGVQGAADAMNNEAGGMALGKAASLGKSAVKGVAGAASDALASRWEQALPSGARPFADSSDATFGKVRDASSGGAPKMMAPPAGDLAELGAQMPRPWIAGTARQGSKELRRIAEPLAEDAKIGMAGARGAVVEPEAEAALRDLHTGRGAAADHESLDALREALKYEKTTPARITPGRPDQTVRTPARITPGSPDTWVVPPQTTQATLSGGGRTVPAEGAASTTRVGGSAPLVEPARYETTPGYPSTVNAATKRTMKPGEDVVNSAYNNPELHNKALESDRARRASAEVKSVNLEKGTLGGVRGDALVDAFKARAQGITPEAAEIAGKDASQLEALADSMTRQRSGVAVNGPSRGGVRGAVQYVTTKAQGPDSTMLGFRPETPQNALLRNSARQVEAEAGMRGFAPRNPAETQAMEEAGRGVFRPSPAPNLRAALQPAANMSTSLSPGQIAALRALIAAKNNR